MNRTVHCTTNYKALLPYLRVLNDAQDECGCAWSAYEVLSFDLCGGNIHDGYTPFIVLNIDTSVK